MVKLLYQGHGSFRVQKEGGMVIYIDPYAGEGYDLPADLILVTHQHGDHNQIQLPTRNAGCRVISNTEALAGGKHQCLEVMEAEIEAVEASNSHHDSKSCVGYIITLGGVSIYAAGDTSKTKMMEDFAARKLDYALLPCDGVYNMSVTESAECAKIIGARHSIPIHLSPGNLFDRERAEQFNTPGRLIIEPGQEVEL